MKAQEQKAWDMARNILPNFEFVDRLSRRSLAQYLGVHPNTIYEDEKVLVDWHAPYRDGIQLHPSIPLGRGGRPRLTPYRIWLLLLVRFLVVYTQDRGEAINFVINPANQALISKDNFQHIKQGATKNGKNSQIRRISAA